MIRRMVCFFHQPIGILTVSLGLIVLMDVSFIASETYRWRKKKNQEKNTQKESVTL